SVKPALHLVMEVLQKHVDLKSHEYVVVALWILHAHVFDSFMVTPRLALLSPVRGCGKTTVLDVISALVPRSQKTDHTSPAAIYHLLKLVQCTMLIDEGDNLDLKHNALLRAVLNSGHRKGGAITRYMNGEPTAFPTFAPMAIAAIGRLSLPLMQR